MTRATACASAAWEMVCCGRGRELCTWAECKGNAVVKIGGGALGGSERIAVEVEAVDAFAGGGAHDAGLKALAVLFQTVALLAVAALEMPSRVLQLLLAGG